MINHSDNTPFIVSLNANKVLEFRRDRNLSDKQLNDLAKLDAKLNAGIHIAGKFIQSPNTQEKAIFIAHQIANALNNDNEPTLALACAFLATRYPELKQLVISTHEDRISFELINDKEFAEQAPIKFVSKKDLI